MNKKLAIQVCATAQGETAVARALREAAARAKAAERRTTKCRYCDTLVEIPEAAEAGVDLDGSVLCDECDLHEYACNIAEDFDNGHIFAWRVKEVKEKIAEGGWVIHFDHEGTPSWARKEAA